MKNRTENLYGFEIVARRHGNGKSYTLKQYVKVLYAKNQRYLEGEKSYIDQWYDRVLSVAKKSYGGNLVSKVGGAEEYFYKVVKARVDAGMSIKEAIKFVITEQVIPKAVVGRHNFLAGFRENAPADYEKFMNIIRRDGETAPDPSKLRYSGDDTYIYQTVKGTFVTIQLIHSPEEWRITV